MTTSRARKGAEAPPKAAADTAEQEEPAGLLTNGQATIHERVLAVMADVVGIAKNRRVSEGAIRFSFRGIDDVMNHLGPAFRRHGLFLTSEVNDVSYTNVTTSGNKASCAIRVNVTYELIDVNGEKIGTNVVGESWDNGDKGTAKAMSVALRTAMLQMFMLPTGDPDPDEQIYERANYDHQRQVDQLAKAKTREQAVSIYNQAERLGANQEQLEELKAKGMELPVVAQTIRQQPDNRPAGGERGDEPATVPAAPDDDVAANDPALDQGWNPGHPPQQSDGP